jgi:ferredoxin
MKRQIIQIDEQKCTGCELCIPGCPEGAIQMIDGKARLISDLFCDGLGACIGHCPEGAITIEEREAEPYDEAKVMDNIIRQGDNTIKAHIKHLKNHNQTDLLNQALKILEERNINFSVDEQPESEPFQGCPGSRTLNFRQNPPLASYQQSGQPSALTHWPIQMHLISPTAPHYQNADVVLAADCVAFSMGDFHNTYLKDKKLAIACPKLDDGQKMYLEKLKILINEAKINTLTVIIMQVPCCGGLLHLAQTAAEQASHKVPIKMVKVGLDGNVLQEEWI